VVGYRSSTSYGYYYSSNMKGVAVTYHSNYDITIEGKKILIHRRRFY
jgi:hypothetical protein